MSEKKSNLLIPLGIGAAVVVGGSATLGYLYLRGAFSDAHNPLASAKLVPDKALLATFISTENKAWSQLQQFGTPEAQQVIGKGMTDFKNQMFTESNIDYEKDVQPWLGSVMVAMLPSNAVPSSPENPPASSEPNVLVVVGIKDKISAFNFANKLKSQSKGKIQESDYKGVKILEETGNSSKNYTAILNDHVVISSQRKAVELAIDTAKGQSSLASQESLKTLLANGVEIPNPVAQVYVPDYGNFIQEWLASNPNANQLPPQTLNQLKQLKSLVMGVGIDKDGIRMKAIGKLDPSAVKVQYKPTPGKVIAQFPLETIALVAGQGINQTWSTVAEQTKTNPQLQQQIEQMRQQLRTSTNLDLDKDIFGWMDGEFGLGVIPSNEGVLASVGFGGALVVKTSDRQTAEATLAKFDNFAKTNSVTISEKTVNGKTVTEWAIPQQGVWIGHGWLDQNSLVIAIGGPIFEAMANNSNSLDKSPSFQSITGSLSQPNVGFFYLDFDKTMAVVNRNIPPVYRNAIPPETNAVLNSIRGIGIAATQPDASTSKVEMLLALKPKSSK